MGTGAKGRNGGIAVRKVDTFKYTAGICVAGEHTGSPHQVETSPAGKDCGAVA